MKSQHDQQDSVIHLVNHKICTEDIIIYLHGVCRDLLWNSVQN